ncbi:LCP family protein, partial [Saccharopolyspora cebuensis]
ARPGRPAAGAAGAAAAGAAAAGAAAGAGTGDPEATTQHSPVRPPEAAAPAPGAERTKVARPVRPAPADAEETAIVEAVPADDEYAELDEYADDFDDLDDEDQPREERHNDVDEIDATLARFSAVHDEIAEEEAERRKKYSWLLGKRKEPELGTDLAFDFVEGRDGRSRMEWKKQQRKRRTNLIVMAVAVACSLTVFVTIGMAWSAKSWVDGKFKEVLALDPNSASIKDAPKQTGDQNFLLVGSDTRAGATAADGVGTAEEAPGARSDTTMIAHIPADRSRVVVVSFPRDLKVDMPACQAWDPATGQYGAELPPREDVRLNEAYAAGGPLCTTKVIQQISGLRMDSFLGIDFQGFESMVEAVGGVEICTEKPIIDDTLGTVIPTAGTHVLKGDQALNYVRARHVQGDPTSDYGRMQRQQMFLSALLRKAMSGQVLLDPGKLTDFVNAVAANTFGENVRTDNLMSLGQSLRGLDASKVTFITVPTTGYADDNGMEVLREGDTEALFRAIIEGAPVAAEPTTATPRQVAGSTDLPPENQPSGGSARRPAQPPTAPPPPPEAPENLSTVNAGTDLCG